MALILKLETADSIAAPTAGRGTLFLNPDNQLLVKTTSGNITSVATLTATGNTSVMYNNAGEVGLSGNMTFNNTTNTFAVTNANIGNLTVTGTLIAGDIAVSSIANGTSNVDITGVSGNVTISVAGNANVLTVTNTGIIVSGTANVGNLGTEKILASDSITTTQQLISNVSSGTAPLVIKSTTQVANLNVATAGLATFATTANAVAGANVSGQVANALVAGTVYTNAQPNITSTGTLTSLAVTGNISAGNVSATNFTGLASSATVAASANAVAGANVSGQVANALVAGTVYTNAQGNITSVGTLTSLAVTGTTTSGNFATAGNITASFLVSNIATGTAPLTVTSTTVVPNLYVSRANVSDYDSITTQTTGTFYPTFVNGNTTANYQNFSNANLSFNAATGALSATLFTGTLTTAAQPNITSVGTLTSLTVTGNVSAGNVSGTLLTGTLSTAAQTNITSVGTLTSLAVTGNITSGNLSGTSIAGTLTTAAQTNITSVGTLGALAVTGNITSGNLSGTSIVGTLTTAAQTNITSVGTLTSLAVTGNVTMANVVASTYDITGVAPAVSAAGTTQGTGTVLAKAINVVSTVATSSGVVLPVAVAGMRITVMNTSANSLAVYPASTGIINNQAANVAYTQDAGARLDFISVSATQWYTLNATYG
jgi:hypothetical protein